MSWEWRRGSSAPRRFARLCPIVDVTKGVIGALYDHHEGYLDPHGTTHAFAIAARNRGAKVILRNRVVELQAPPPRAGGLSHRDRARSLANMWSMPPVSGRARLARWWASDLPVVPMSTPLSGDRGYPRTRRARPRNRLCHRSGGLHLHAARDGKASFWASTNASRATGCPRARPGITAWTFCPPISTGSCPNCPSGSNVSPACATPASANG
jgi:hypothetical protein